MNDPSPVSAPLLTIGVASLFPWIQERGDRVLWVDDEATLTWNDFGRRVEDCRSQAIQSGVKAGELVVTPGAGGIDSLAWMFAIADLGGVVVPLRPERFVELTLWKRFLAIDWCVEGHELVRDPGGEWSAEGLALRRALRDSGHAGLVLATGGTTGTPKVMLHDLESLWSAIAVRSTDCPRRILPLMKFDHIGGLDAAWRAMAAGHVLVAPPNPFSVSNVAAAIARHRVEVLPATPSFLSLLLVGDVIRSHDLSSLRTIPFGAEPMNPALLHRLRLVFPHVDFVERFGTSETGTLPVVGTTEGLVLRPGTNPFSWKVVDGELWIQGPTRALGYLSGGAEGLSVAGWFRTGDLAVESPTGAIRVVGRRTELINVGGEKVLPSTVESALLEHPSVADCRVSGLANAFLGQIVAADIVWAGKETDSLTVKRILHDFVAAVLPKSHLPVVVRLARSIDRTDNLKKPRRSCQ